MSGPNTRNPGATGSLLIAGGVTEIGDGLAQRRLNRPRRVAKFALGLFDRKGRRAPRDPHTFRRSGRRFSRHIVGDEFHHCGGGFRDLGGDRNKKTTAGGFFFPKREKLPSPGGFSAPKITASPLAPPPWPH